MAENKTLRLNKVLKELNISLDRAIEYLQYKGIEVEARPTTRIPNEVYKVLLIGFQTDKSKKAASIEVREEKRKEKEAMRQVQEDQLEKRRQVEVKKEIVKSEKLEFPKQEEAKITEKDSLSEVTDQNSQKVDLVIEEKKLKDTDKKIQKEEKKEVKKEQVEHNKKDLLETNQITDLETQEKVEEVEKSIESKEQEVVTDKIIKPVDTFKIVTPDKKHTKKEELVDGDKGVVVNKSDSEKLETRYKKLDGPKLTGEVIDLGKFQKPPRKKKVQDNKLENTQKRKRKRILKPGQGKQLQNNDQAKTNKKEAVNKESKVNDNNLSKKKGLGQNRLNNDNKGVNKTPRRRFDNRKQVLKEELSEADVQKQIRDTLEKLQGKSQKNKGAKYRRNKRDLHRQQSQKDLEQAQEESKTLKVTEFVTASEIATMMEIPVTQIISMCMSLGMMVTMNQRLDAETLKIVVEEFGFSVEFISTELEDSIEIEKDKPEDLEPRAPIITVMGHVDHGKTSLLDYIREENVIAGESGGITQHIGAYSVELKDGNRLTFLDTPGHEAFTAMRARGTQVTDVVIIVIATDDRVMPQTKEAISHAQAAKVPIIFALNKVDKPTSNPDKIKEELASMNLLIEDWGGKYQSQDISAKTGQGVEELLEKVILEAEVLELKTNPNKNAIGTVVEAQLDKGRGYVSTLLVQEGTLKVGDYVLAGKNSGKARAIFDERGNSLNLASPSTPILLLGLDGAPQAGDRFNVFDDEREAKQIANKRSQLQRELSVRTHKHLSLEEIGRRIALGDFKELNLILKGDVDGSVEALTDSFQKLSTEEIQVNIIYKAVGAITESDILLASASNAIVIGFNVRPQGNARVIADKEEVDIRMYSIIYNAINDLKDAMEGMLSPEMKEEITGNLEIREVYKISKVGNIAGCMVVQGNILRNSMIRLIREGVVIHSGELASLKRFKEDVKEVSKGYDCGLQIKNYNDIIKGDVIEAYKEVAVKKKL